MMGQRTSEDAEAVIGQGALAVVTTFEQIEAAADALRRREQGGKQLTEWSRLPNATKQKWRSKVHCVIAAMNSAGVTEQSPRVPETR